MFLAIVIQAVLYSAPIWVSILWIRSSVSTRKKIHRTAIAVSIAAFFFGAFHAGDRDPWQWPSAYYLHGSVLDAAIHVGEYVGFPVSRLTEQEQRRLIPQLQAD